MTAAGGRRLWLVRHGETEGQSSIRYHGSNDVPLSDLGRAQIRALLPLFAGTSLAGAVHSPLRRAAESAAILAADLGLPPGALTPEARLAEISFGACEGLTADEIDAAFPAFWADYRAGRLDAFPGGESRTAFARRIAAAARDLIASPWRADLLVVAHRGTVSQMVRALLGDRAAAGADFGVPLASLTVLVEARGAWHLDRLGVRN